MKTKICKKCGKEKSINDFYAHKEMSDGHLSFCKECVRKRVIEHRQNNIERIREYDRNRPNARERRIKEIQAIKKNAQRYKKYKEQKKEWAKRNKNKRNAHNKIKRALQKGVILKPDKCQICGKTNCNIQGHHYDYTKPLNVLWVCCECHGKLHKKHNKMFINFENFLINESKG